MKMSLPLFLERSARCGETKVAPSGKTPQEECLKKRKEKDKSSIICYECKRLGHFKFECPELEKC